MGNKCCNNITVDSRQEKVCEDNQYENNSPPVQTATTLKNSFHPLSSDLKPNSKASKMSNVSGAIYTSVIPPSQQHQHRDSVWRGLQMNSVPPSEFFVSNVKWPDRSSCSNAGMSSIRFTYKNSQHSQQKSNSMAIKKSTFQLQNQQKNHSKIQN